MGVPVAEQKVYVDVDIPDLVEIPGKTGNKFAAGVKNFFSGCLEYLY